ncbi:MAG: glycosyltransferase family 39 protein [Planctomycetes bacterium]|nr:glycosyltransferase family 39 protein [Planctomycetota bacterium]
MHEIAADAPDEREPRALVAWNACLLLVVGWGGYLAATLARVHYAPNADEAWYVRYASELSTQGLDAFPALFERYLADPAVQIYPNPLRVLYLVVAAGWSELFGASFESLSRLSLAAHLGAVLATFAGARRAFGARRALALAALLAASPLCSGLARRALMDSFATLTLVLAFWAFLGWVRECGSRRGAALFALALFAALVAKENHVLFVPAFALGLVGFTRSERRALPWGLALAAFAVPLAAAGATFALAAGGFGRVVELGRVILESPATNEYAQRYGGGPWYRYVVDFLVLSPWVTLAACAAIGGLCFARLGRGRRELVFCVAFLAFALLVFALFTKNVRYLAPLEVAWRALAVWFAFELGVRGFGRHGVRVAYVLIAAACVADAWSFHTLFVERELYDPVSAALLGLREIVPVR